MCSVQVLGSSHGEVIITVSPTAASQRLQSTEQIPDNCARVSTARSALSLLPVQPLLPRAPAGEAGAAAQRGDVPGHAGQRRAGGGRPRLPGAGRALEQEAGGGGTRPRGCGGSEDRSQVDITCVRCEGQCEVSGMSSRGSPFSARGRWECLALSTGGGWQPCSLPTPGPFNVGPLQTQ